jgi:hypothetical protein
MTPAPFDPRPLKDKVLGAGAEKFSWMRPYEHYDEVLTRYAAWLVTLREKKYTVIDAHAALLKHIATMRKEDPAYCVSADGIHPNANGHLVIALEMLKELKAPTAVVDIAIDVKNDPPTKSDIKIILVKKNSAAFTFSLPRPMPVDPAWTARAKEIEEFDARINRHALKIEGLGGFLAIRVGDPKAIVKRVSIRADEIAKGIDLAKVLDVSADKSAAVWKLIDEKNRILGPAWLTHVGHNRPGTPKGLPFEQALKKAAGLDEEIRKLCQPTEVRLGIGPLGK